MTKVLFILGCPGSGKSTAASDIVQYVQEKHKSWSPFRINDYDILLAMFQADIKHRRFRPAKHKGFNVTDFSVLDDALKEAEMKAQEHISLAKKGLITIEFARNDYRHALKQLSSGLLKDAYFLFLKAEKNTCFERIRARIAHPASTDDHYVSKYIFDTYYRSDIKPYIPTDLKTDYGIDNQKVEIIDNNGSLQDFLTKVRRFVDVILEKETSGTS